MKISTYLKIARNQNMIRNLKQENRQLKKVGYKHTIIHLETPHELEYKANYMGRCSCGCEKELYKGMAVIAVGGSLMSGQMIHIDCLESYLKQNLVIL